MENPNVTHCCLKLSVVLAFLFVFTIPQVVFSQINLVSDGSFENNINIPLNLSQGTDELQRCVPSWRTATSLSPDYFHANVTTSCDKSGGANFNAVSTGFRPNFIGEENPSSGNAYAGIVVRVDTIIGNTPTVISSEYIAGKIEDLLNGNKLLPGHKYTVSFKVSLAEGSEVAVNNIGAYIGSNLTIPIANSSVLAYAPQVYEAGIIFQTVGWYTVTNTFIASGNEDVIIIGHFPQSPGLPATTAMARTGDQYCYPTTRGEFLGYYYIDDVELYECSCYPAIKTIYTSETNITNPHVDSCYYKFDLYMSRESCSNVKYAEIIDDATGQVLLQKTQLANVIFGGFVSLNENIIKGPKGFLALPKANAPKVIRTVLYDINGVKICDFINTIQGCKCCKGFGVEFINSDTISNEKCCVNIDFRNDSAACNAYGFRLRIAGEPPLPASIVSSSSSDISKWRHVQGQAPKWMGVQPLAPNTHAIVGNMCVSKLTRDRTVIIDFLDRDSTSILCSIEKPLPACKCACSKTDILTTFINAQSQDTGKCCWDMVVTDKIGGCAIKSVKIAEGSNILLTSDLLRVTYPGDPTSTVLKGFCMKKFAGTKTLNVTYYSPAGEELCTVPVTIEGCGGCEGDCNKVRTEFLETNNQDATKCCWKINIENQQGSCMDIYRVVLLENGAQIFSKDFGNTPVKPGDALRTIGTYCFTDVKGPRKITIQYQGAHAGTNEDPHVMCETITTLNCPCGVCWVDSIKYPEFPEYPFETTVIPVGDFEDCCFDLFVKNTSTCDIWTVDGLLFLLDSLKSTNQQLFVGGNGQWKGAIWGTGGVKFTKTKEVIKAGDIEYIGRICVSPSLTPIKLHTQLIKDAILQCADVAPPIILNCSQSSGNCCDNLYAYMIEDTTHLIEPVSGCLCKFKIHAGYYPNLPCEITAVKIISLNSETTVVPDLGIFHLPGDIGTVCLNPSIPGYGTFTFSTSIMVLFLDANGKIVCHRVLSQTCTRTIYPPGDDDTPDGTSKRENTDPLSAGNDLQKGLPAFSCIPNPFSDETEFVYSIPVGGKVRLELLDIQGRFIEQVENMDKPAGKYSVKYQNKKLSPGIYIARLVINDTIHTIKILIE